MPGGVFEEGAMTLYLMKVRRPIMPNWSTTMFAGMFVTSPGEH